MKGLAQLSVNGRSRSLSLVLYLKVVVMAATKCRRWVLKTRSEGIPKLLDFDIVEEDLPPLKDGGLELVYTPSQAGEPRCMFFINLVFFLLSSKLRQSGWLLTLTWGGYVHSVRPATIFFLFYTDLWSRQWRWETQWLEVKLGGTE